MVVAPFPGPTPVTEADLSPEFSDDALALEFSDRHVDDLRYVSLWGKWLYWHDTHWTIEDTLKAFDFARSVAREFATACRNDDDARKIASAKTVAAIEKLARADRRHASTANQWDADLWALNATSATLDLRTGLARRHCSNDYLTKITAVAADRNCPIPLWTAFLNRVTAQDHDLQAYLQRVVGYCMSGITSEHVLFFLYGTGANGKGLFLNTLTAIWNDYATVAPMETFIETRGDKHPTELAFLRGARIVISQETEKGKRWAESKIKTLTGGDPITARYMRQDFFTFIPQFKLLIAGNHKPSLRSVDEAIRRRFNLIPFIVTIPEHERDPQLFEKLKPEWPGILAWAFDGCMEWQKQGLNPPAAVRNATEAYLGAEDAIGNWIDECCGVEPAYTQLKSDLYASWKAWADKAGEYAGSQKAFSLGMESRGFIPCRDGAGQRMFRGIGLKHGF